MKHSLRYLCAALLAGAVSLPAAAHYFWLEAGDNNNEARLYYGEYQEGLREKSPGILDNILNPVVWQPSADGARKPLPVVTRADHIAVAAIGLPVLMERAGGRVIDMSKHGGQGKVRNMVYARLDVPGSGSAPVLALDMLPVKGSPELVRVVFNSAPLPKTKVSVYAPNGWSRELYSDAQGELRIAVPWAGTYVLYVTHTQPQKGEIGGEMYEALRHGTTLSLRFAQPLAVK